MPAAVPLAAVQPAVPQVTKERSFPIQLPTPAIEQTATM